jgi:uncharacterized membrane protein
MNDILNLPLKTLRTIRAYWRRLWVRVVLFGLLAVAAILGSSVVSLLLPESWIMTMESQSADRLLNLIANAMLVVTTFSLTVMVSVYRASSSQFTPRVHRLIREDPVTQNTLATFIGAYVYALVGIVLREFGFYSQEHTFTLFCMTVVVLGVIVWTLIRWTLHLQTLGSLLASSRQIEDTTRRELQQRLARPCLGAKPLPDVVPEDGLTVLSAESGYLQHIHPEALQALAEEERVEIYMLVPVGEYVFIRTPIARIVGVPSDLDKDRRQDLSRRVQQNFALGDERTYDQDPRFGLQTLSEIGSKALSPGINDFGTARDIVNRAGRILSDFKDERGGETDPEFPRLYVSPLSPAEMLTDAFDGIARDGAHLIEVQARLQKVLGGLMHHPDAGLSSAAERKAEEYRDRARSAIDWLPDRRALDEVRATGGD